MLIEIGELGAAGVAAGSRDACATLPGVPAPASGAGAGSAAVTPALAVAGGGALGAALGATGELGEGEAEVVAAFAVPGVSGLCSTTRAGADLSGAAFGWGRDWASAFGATATISRIGAKLRRVRRVRRVRGVGLARDGTSEFDMVRNVLRRIRSKYSQRCAGCSPLFLHSASEHR